MTLPLKSFDFACGIWRWLNAIKPTHPGPTDNQNPFGTMKDEKLGTWDFRFEPNSSKKTRELERRELGIVLPIDSCMYDTQQDNTTLL
jgi:hypothetical protein